MQELSPSRAYFPYPAYGQGDGGDGADGSVEHQSVIDLVGEDEDVRAVPQNVCDGQNILLLKHAAGGVGGAVDEDDLGLFRAQLMGRGAEAMEWFMKVNACSQMEFHAALGEANEAYKRRNRVEGWITDISWLKNKYDIILGENL